ncbi:class I SAM-dependent methyltransferase [Orrella dioscoreae]|uniref:FIG005121: SAM-dependent methyltransferase n=1 Tax=Orrella dioscoreae TaxID=1851544 RepID=A0A1C3JXX5_9BURK|nr:class I SAM-dependent methyltransferase [Orrella dioscoreae]SBT24111.1 FIG005121: SAM-dependent methyltransferase [Orrella dioscoreae]SOE51458.1 FIG005121: SAM-dependent methyltransferase [Orrella dioscoreae]
MAEETSIVELGDWFDTPPGRYVRAWEQAQFDAIVADVFGFNALQVGLPSLDLLQANRMPFKVFVGDSLAKAELASQWQAQVVARPEALPFESDSIDLLVLPHAFESTDEPHRVLREVERVLVPEGRVVVSGFNPWSLWGLRANLPGMPPWLPHPPSAQVSLARLKDWFKLLSFEVDRGRFGCYAPACMTDVWLRRWAFMEKAGDRWWPVCGATYVVSAVKRVAGARIIGAPWKKRRRARRVAVPVPQGSGGAHRAQAEAVGHTATGIKE